METRKGWDIYEVLGWMLWLTVGILSGFLLREYLKKRRGGRKRQGKKH